MYDLIIKNGKIVDGSGNPWYRADIAVKDGKIARIARKGIGEANKFIDAEGLVVSPGFCDLHTHSDYTILSSPRAESTLHQGVTTEGVGQCGISAYALTVDHQANASAEAAMFGSRYLREFKIDWTTLAEWRDRVESQGVAINMAPYAGHGAIRQSVMGVEGKGGERYDPTPEEMGKMKALLRQAMEDGAFGLSTGLRYPWGRNATTEEVIELCQVVAEYGGIYISHMRSEEDTLIESAIELIRICEEAGVPGSMTHHKAIFPENWGKPTETMRLIDRARQRGLEIICDFYPWEHAAEGNLGGLFAPYFGSPQASPEEVEHARENLAQAIQDPILWEKIKKFNLEAFETEDAANQVRKKELAGRGVVAPNLWNPETFNYIVYSRCHPEFFGKNLREVTRLLGMEDYQEAARRLYQGDGGLTLVAGGSMCEEDILTILRHPASAISTDGAAFDEKPDLSDPLVWAHPRNYGTYAKVLQRYVREMKVLQLEEAVRKMTSLPLGFLGIRDRGLVNEGMWADLTIFNPQTITNNATYSDPCVYPEGIEYVLVNGVVAIHNGQHTGALAGKVLRRV